MSKAKKKTDPVVLLLDVVIIIMVFVIIYFGISLKFYYNFAKETETFMQDPQMMAFELSNNNYDSLVQGRYINEYNGDTDSKTYHAIAYYVEAVSKYKIYETKGYEERAKEQREIMDAAREEMGDAIIFADRIDKMFGMK